MRNMNKQNNSTAMLDRSCVLRNGRHYWWLRRAQDILLSLLAIAVLCPFLLLIALIIILDVALDGGGRRWLPAVGA